MAYAVPTYVECSEGGCTLRSTYEVRNQRNEVVRRCCRRHAEALVRKLSAAEDAVARAAGSG